MRGMMFVIRAAAAVPERKAKTSTKVTGQPWASLGRMPTKLQEDTESREKPYNTPIDPGKGAGGEGRGVNQLEGWGKGVGFDCVAGGANSVAWQRLCSRGKIAMSESVNCKTPIIES